MSKTPEFAVAVDCPPTAPTPPTDPRPWCGTPTTPPCPAATVHHLRNTLIYQLAGLDAGREQIVAAAGQVDQYLVAALGAGFMLLRPIAQN
jgi:hypothetical protein